MYENLNNLLVVSDALSMEKYDETQIETGFRSLSEIYNEKNGLIAFESSLVVYPAIENSDLPCLSSINKDSWKLAYSKEVQLLCYFCRDGFGHQYGISSSGGIFKLNPESGALSPHSSDIDTWAKKIMSDYDYETGWSLLNEWQVLNDEVIGPNQCLIPVKPFCIGGEFEVDNLRLVDLGLALIKYSQLYSQSKSFVKGEKVNVDW